MEQITFNPNNEPYYSEDFIKGFKCGAQRQFEADMADRIKEAPSIDIVRCRECIHNSWNTDYDYTCIWDDDFADREQTPDDFCSYGERSSE